MHRCVVYDERRDRISLEEMEQAYADLHTNVNYCRAHLPAGKTGDVMVKVWWNAVTRNSAFADAMFDLVNAAARKHNEGTNPGLEIPEPYRMRGSDSERKRYQGEPFTYCLVGRLGQRIKNLMPPLSASDDDPVHRKMEFGNDVVGRFTVTFSRQSPAGVTEGRVEYEGDYPWVVPAAPGLLN